LPPPGGSRQAFKVRPDRSLEKSSEPHV
jgi:hypothetical protein